MIQLIKATDTAWMIDPARGALLYNATKNIDSYTHLQHWQNRKNSRRREMQWSADDDGESIDDCEPIDDDDGYMQTPYSIENSTAIFKITGLMTKRPASYSEGTSTILLRKAYRAAASDPRVSAALTIIDSPGGQAAGNGDLAREMQSISAQMPHACYIEDCGCSAAYYAAVNNSAGLFSNPEATVGSVGTIFVLYDTSELYAQEGIKPFVFASGQWKAVGADGTEITKEQQDYLQNYLMQVNAPFQKIVADRRKLTPAQQTEIFKAGLYFAPQAVHLNLTDGIKTLDEVKSLLQSKPTGKPGKHATQTTPALQTSAPPALLPQKEPKMRQKFISLLNVFGLRAIALNMMASTSEEPEQIVQELAAQVEEQVQEKVKEHPLMATLAANGIYDTQTLGSVLQNAEVGKTALEGLRADTKRQAVRCFGAETAVGFTTAVDHYTYKQALTMRDAWQAQADATYGIGESGQAPARATAPARLHEAVSAEGDTAQKSNWDKLTPEQQAVANKMSITTPEQRENFAANALALGN